jgi:hypothetical protein
MIKAVLDTNVLISGFISPHGTPAKIITEWRKKRFELVLSPAIIKEVSDVLQRDKIRRYYEYIDKNLAPKFIMGLKRFATIVPGAIEVNVIDTDPADNIFLAAALEGEADFVISGDEHLLTLKEYKNITILKPAEFLTHLNKQ